MSDPQIRYGQYLGAIRRHHRQISYNDVHALERKTPVSKHCLRPIDVHRLLTPYISVRLAEQIRAVIPLALMLVGFQALALRTPPDEALAIALGIVAVIIGLMFFMEGVKTGLMPLAESLGFLLPERAGTLTILGFGGVLGVAATFAEPAIGALQLAGESVSAERTGLLKTLLGPEVSLLVAAVAVGVGAAVILGMLRFMFGWRLKVLVSVIVPVCLAMTLYAATRPGLNQVLGLAWDCGGITTGPVTVPLVLAVGIGVAAAAGRGDNPLSGLGIVTLASLLPVIGVIGAGIYLDARGVTYGLPLVMPTPHWYQMTPFAEMINAARAVLPLVLLLFLAQRLLLGERLRHVNVLVYGILMALLGMMVFNVGLVNGLVDLGNQAGHNVPWAFSPHHDTGAPPLYPRMLGLAMTLVFAFVVGYGATVAEPALNAMGLTVENLTDGAFRKRLLVHAVGLGVGIGAALGVAKILFDLPLAWMLVMAYTLALILTWFAREELVNLAWDCAGVTTGPVTVPLLLALGVGLAHAVGAAEGFGILALGSVGPIISVQAFGLWIQWNTRASKENKRP